MVVILSTVLLLPIQATYEFVLGYVDAFSVSSLPIIFVVFVPMCYSGQGLLDASEVVGLQVYAREWLCETPASRRVCTIVMLRASRPARITCRGFGAMGLPLCKSVLKSWFSYLNTLVKFSTKTASELV
ncbi:uncharacterized protein LOC127749887 [Frankliniella occidentalis]|uniref:Uncharacterized protein LOC127749887 n=1 Tax=Frankliniella occidentalis TaxID=133901 RepID=A0A9C6U5R7_FRAOC|nr:uncharacterized protein LOC127749887 [Frankliniella occidentalis]